MQGQTISAKEHNPLFLEFMAEDDKKKHFISTLGVSTATYTFLSIHPRYKKFSPFKKRLISFSSAMLLGLVKETADGFHNKSLNKFTFEQLKSYFAGTLI